MQPDDQSLILDMLIAARQASGYVRHVTLPDFYASEVLQDAVIRQMQIVGEAASQVSLALREAHPEIPWNEIVAMRHRLVHDYRRINRDIVWATVHDALPGLIAALEALVPAPED